MFKYFRTLYFLILFFFEDSYLIYLGRAKDNYYYPIAMVYRTILKNHLCRPFKNSHTITIPSKHAESFQDIILNQRLPRIPNEIVHEELDNWLWQRYRLDLKHIRFKGNVIVSFTYTY